MVRDRIRARLLRVRRVARGFLNVLRSERDQGAPSRVAAGLTALAVIAVIVGVGIAVSVASGTVAVSYGVIVCAVLLVVAGGALWVGEHRPRAPMT